MSGPSAKFGISKIKPHMLGGADQDSPKVTIALDSNENARGPSPHAVEAARGACATMERYFEQPKQVLSPAIAHFFDLDPDRITIGQGSDDLLARLARAYLQPGDELIRSANGYLKVPNYAYANDAIPISAADNDFTASVDNILDLLSSKTRMVYLANPDNPSGTYLSGSEIRRLHAGLPDDVLLVLDCAYEEFVTADDFESASRLIEETTNVVMTRTFSKVFGLAGARVGWLYAPPAIVDIVDRIGLTFPVSTPSIFACLAALADVDYVQRIVTENTRAKEILTRTLAEAGLTVYPSQTNFVLVHFSDPLRPAARASEYLRNQGIAIRRFSAPAYQNYARITLGVESENAAVARELKTYMEYAEDETQRVGG